MAEVGLTRASPPVVLFVSHDASLTGAPSCLGELLHSLVATTPAFRPVVFVRGDGPLLPAWRATGLRIEVHPRRAGLGLFGKVLQRLGALARYVRLLLEIRPALIYSNTILNGPEVVLGRVLGARTLVHVHEGEAMMRRHRAALRLSRPFTSRYVCVSRYAAAALRRIAGAEAAVVPNGIDADACAAGPARAPGPALVVGVVGAIQPGKGQDIAVRAVAKLRREGRAVRLRLFGDFVDDRYRSELARLVGALGMDREVDFRGPVPDRAAIYAELDALLVASLDESFGRVILEAFAYGRPVVASDVGGVPEIVDNGRNGLLVRPDPAEIAAALRRIHDDPGLGRGLSARAAADVRRRYPLDATLARLRSEIETLLAGAGAARGAQARP